MATSGIAPATGGMQSGAGKFSVPPPTSGGGKMQSSGGGKTNAGGIAPATGTMNVGGSGSKGTANLGTPLTGPVQIKGVQAPSGPQVPATGSMAAPSAGSIANGITNGASGFF